MVALIGGRVNGEVGVTKRVVGRLMPKADRSRCGQTLMESGFSQTRLSICGTVTLALNNTGSLEDKTDKDSSTLGS